MLQYIWVLHGLILKLTFKWLERKSRSQALMQNVLQKMEDQNPQSVDNIDSSDSKDDSMSEIYKSVLK